MYVTQTIKVGKPILVKHHEDDLKIFPTSDVQQMMFEDGVLKVKTENSTYWLQPAENIRGQIAEILGNVSEEIRKKL